MDVCRIKNRPNIQRFFELKDTLLRRLIENYTL